MAMNKLGIDIDGVTRLPNATKKITYSIGDVSTSPEMQTTIEYPDRASFVSANGFITPSEFYGNIVNISSAINSQTDGYLIMSSYGDGTNNENIGWFWSEDIKNWCRYMYIAPGENYYPCWNKIYLSVWNGKNGWIPIPNGIIVPDDWTGYNDVYNIGQFQNKILYKLQEDNIEMHRGVALYFSGAECIEQGNVEIISGIRLKKVSKYSINDTNDFQAVRWQTVPENDVGDTWYNYASTDYRQGITVGIPCVYRLPTDEILLCTNFGYNSDAGRVYEYMYDSHSFFKRDNAEISDNDVLANKLLGTDWKAASRWLNSVCEKFFSKGNDKTIVDNWLNDDELSVDMNDYEKNDYLNMLDSTKTFEQVNINKVNNLKCGFTINRPIITTRTVKSDDYAKKW